MRLFLSFLIAMMMATAADAKPTIVSTSNLNGVSYTIVSFSQNDNTESDAIGVNGACSINATIEGSDVIEVRAVRKASTAAASGTLKTTLTSDLDSSFKFTPGGFYVKLLSTTSTTGGSLVRIHCTGNDVGSGGAAPGVNVADFGAIPNDSSVNVFPIVNAAVVAADAASGGNGGTVHFPCGRYTGVNTLGFFKASLPGGSIGVDRDDITFQAEADGCVDIVLDSQTTIAAEIMAVCDDALVDPGGCSSGAVITGFRSIGINYIDLDPVAHIPGYDTDLGTGCYDNFDTPVGAPQTSGSKDGICDSDGVTLTGEESHGVFLKGCADCWIIGGSVEGIGDEGIAWEKANSWGGVIGLECKQLGSSSAACISTNSTSSSAGGKGIDLIGIAGSALTADPNGDCTQTCTDLFDSGGPPQVSGSPDGKCDSDAFTGTNCQISGGYINIEAQNVGSPTSNVRVLNPKLKGEAVNGLVSFSATSGNIDGAIISGAELYNTEPFAFGAINAVTASGQTIDRLIIKDNFMRGPGVWMTDGGDGIADVVIEGNVVEWDGIYTFRSPMRPQAEGMILTNNSVTGGPNPCLNFSGGARIELNTFVADSCGDAADAVQFSGSATTPPNNLTGLKVYGQVPPATCTAAGVPAKCCTGSGTGCTGVVTGTNNGIAGLTSSDISLYDSYVSGVRFDGIRLVRRAWRNTVEHWGRAGGSRYGIFNDSFSVASDIKFNHVSGYPPDSNAQPCIRIADNLNNGHDESEVWGNTLRDCGSSVGILEDANSVGASCVNNVILCDDTASGHSWCVDPGTPPSETCTTEIGGTYGFYK